MALYTVSLRKFSFNFRDIKYRYYDLIDVILCRFTNLHVRKIWSTCRTEIATRYEVKVAYNCEVFPCLRQSRQVHCEGQLWLCWAASDDVTPIKKSASHNMLHKLTLCQHVNSHINHLFTFLYVLLFCILNVIYDPISFSD